jgi:hypothetical protein
MRNVKVHIIALGVELNYLTQIQNMKVVRVGLLFFNQYQMFLKKKLICIPAINELSITVKNVVGTMAIFLMTAQNPLEKDIAITACA